VAEFGRWKYCPNCRALLTFDPPTHATCPNCGFTQYASSQPTACALCVRDGQLLLVRRRGEPFRGYWDLPGGFLDEGEHPLDGLKRELREETGLEIEPCDFVGVWMDRYGTDDWSIATINLYWTARISSGDANAADDVTELEWFPADALPEPHEFAFHIADVVATWRRTLEAGARSP
jgi:8-oxo-dGTP diphosphatase